MEPEDIDGERRKAWAGPAWNGASYETPEEKRQRLEAAGWKFGDADDFLERPEIVPADRQDLAQWIAVPNTVGRALVDMSNHCLAASVADIVDHIREYEEEG